MVVSADQVWQINGMGQWHGKKQLERDVSNHVVTVDLEPEDEDGIAEWRVYDALDPEHEEFTVPEGCFTRFVRHLDAEADDTMDDGGDDMD